MVGRAFTPAAGEEPGRQCGKIAPDFLPGNGKGPPGRGLLGKAVRGGRERPPYKLRYPPCQTIQQGRCGKAFISRAFSGTACRLPWIVGRAFTPAAGKGPGRQSGKNTPGLPLGKGEVLFGRELPGKAVRGGRNRPPYNARLTGSRHKTVNPVHSRCPVGAGRKGTGEEQKLNDKQRPVRKNPRLAGFDYASRRFYF